MNKLNSLIERFSLRRRAECNCAIAVIALLCGLAVVGRAQTSDRGAIAGHVTIDGKVAMGATIRLRRGDNFIMESAPKPIEVKTDQTGRYLAADLPAGDYYVSPDVPGWVITNLNQFWQFSHVTIQPGKTVENIDFALARGGAISGRVLNLAGQPLTKTQVSYYRYDKYSGRWHLENTVGVDDGGAYRFIGLPAGSYRISAYNDQYPSTYHPNATDERNAAIVEVKLGSEITDVDIRFGRPTNSYSAAGRVIDAETGEPLPNFSVSWQWNEGSHNNGEPLPGAAETAAAGRFQFTQLSPGRRAVVVHASPGSRDYYGDAISFEITDDDVTGLEIKVNRGASISGRIIVEGNVDQTALAQIPQIKLYAWLVNPSSGITNNFTDFQIDGDGSFRFSGLRTGLVRVQEERLPKGFMLLRVERNGQDQGGGFNLGPREQLADVRVIIGYGTGSIRGQVETKGDSVQKCAHCMLFVRRAEKVGPGVPSLVNPLMAVDSNGAFFIEGLFPGEYKLSTRRQPIGKEGDNNYAEQTVIVKDKIETQVKLIINLIHNDQI